MKDRLKQISSNPETLAPLLSKWDQVKQELTLDLKRESYEENEFGFKSVGSITKPTNSDYHLSSDLILADVLHSMSILSIPGEEGLFSFKAEELKQVNLKLKIIF